jgi:hypothetical protein
MKNLLLRILLGIGLILASVYILWQIYLSLVQTDVNGRQVYNVLTGESLA